MFRRKVSPQIAKVIELLVHGYQLWSHVEDKGQRDLLITLPDGSITISEYTYDGSLFIIKVGDDELKFSNSADRKAFVKALRAWERWDEKPRLKAAALAREETAQRIDRNLDSALYHAFG